MFKNLKIEDRVAVSFIPEEKVEIWGIADLSARVIIAKSLSRQGEYHEFDRGTGLSTGGEKILQEHDLAIKEAEEITCTCCGVPQRNFWMAKEFLQGSKNFSCYNCGHLLWMRVNGYVRCVDIDCVKCPPKHTQ